MLKRKVIQRTKKRFGTQVEAYDKYRSEYPKEIYNLLYSLAKTDEIMDILDIGCGTGKSTEPLIRPGMRVVGCDHDSRMLKQAKKNARSHNLHIIYKKCEAENLPFKNNSFDVVTIGNAFHWFANKKVIKNIKRILKPNGLLFIYWKQVNSEDVRLRRKIFRQFNPKYKGSSILITPKECVAVLCKYGFQRVRHLSKKYNFYYTIESAVGRLKTIGIYFNLNNERKKRFNDVATRVFKDYIARKKLIRFLPTIHICYSYKPKIKK